MNGKFKARPTVYRGIQMRSRLEAGFAQWLDARGMSWAYEPAAFAGPKGQYLPDFRIDQLRCSWLLEPVTAYLEVKPKGWPWFDEDEAEALRLHDALMAGMTVIRESDPDALLLLCQPADSPFGSDSEVFTVEYDSFIHQLWPMYADWVRGPGETAVLVRRLHDSKRPWPDGWWKAAK